MKRTKEFLLVFILTTSVTLGQEAVIQGQLFLGIIGIGQNEFVQHKIEAVGPLWVKNNSYEINYFIASNQPAYQSIASTFGNYQQGNNQTTASFNWFWEGIIQSVGSWGLGMYKISNSKYPENYFSLDTRNNVYLDRSVNPDVWFIYNVAESKFYKQNYNYENKPNYYNLMQNYPNPFNPITTIEYTIPKNSFVNIKVYDILGNEVVTLVNEYREAGRHSVKFDASGLSSGLYFCTMNAGGYILTKKFSLIK